MSGAQCHNLADLPSRFHSEDEALAIENAIRAAVDTVMKVIYSACNRTALEHQRTVAGRDREIRSLECRLRSSQSELQLLRSEFVKRQPGEDLSCVVACNARGRNNDESVMGAGNAHDVKCGVWAAPPTHLSPKCHDTVETFPHQHAQTEPPSSEGDGAAGGQLFGCITSLVKEEPSDLETVIKWEVCEGSLLDQQEAQHEAGYQQKEKSAKKETPLCGHGLPHDRPFSTSPAKDDKKLTVLRGLSHQLTQFAANVNTQLTAVNTKLLSMDERMDSLEAKVSCGSSLEETKRKRRAHNPKIAEAVRRLHNSEANCRRYEPEQGLSSPHNEAVTSHLVKILAASPDWQNVDKDAILSACKTYYETVRRNFRYSQPDLAAQAAAMKSSARSRQRRKRLLEARQGVLAAEEVDSWRGITIDMMSDEEDGTCDGMSGWIVRPPSFRSQELTDLCAKLQARLEANPKYTATHHRRLQIGPYSDRMPPNTYDSEAAKKHFKVHLIPHNQL